MSNFLEVVMEAKGKKSLKIQADTEPEDYTQGDEDGEETETEEVPDEEDEGEDIYKLNFLDLYHKDNQ